MEFQIKQITFNDDKATLSLCEGSLASKSINALYYFDTAHARGPFISLVLSIKAWNLGRFTLDYWPKSEGMLGYLSCPSTITFYIDIKYTFFTFPFKKNFLSMTPLGGGTRHLMPSLPFQTRSFLC